MRMVLRCTCVSLGGNKCGQAGLGVEVNFSPCVAATGAPPHAMADPLRALSQARAPLSHSAQSLAFQQDSTPSQLWHASDSLSLLHQPRRHSRLMQFHHARDDDCHPERRQDAGQGEEGEQLEAGNEAALLRSTQEPYVRLMVSAAGREAPDRCRSGEDSRWCACRGGGVAWSVQVARNES